jgi:hypothetical protein
MANIEAKIVDEKVKARGGLKGVSAGSRKTTD